MGSNCCKGDAAGRPLRSTSSIYSRTRAGASLDERFTSADDAGGVRLTVSAARTGDTDVYTLQATNAAGTDTAKVRLEVSSDEAPTGEDPPNFLRRLQDLTVKVGTRTRFLVEIISSTECKVTWYRNERRLLEAERVSLARDGNFWCADVAAVSVDDAGRWTCTAENAGGRASCSAHLNVLVPKAYKRPEFVEELRALLTEQGTVSLECKVVGVPTPVLRWFKDSREIKAGDVFALTANAEDPTSLGTYTCEAVNCMGRAYSSSKVHVVGRGSREGSTRPSSSLAPEPPPIFTKELEDQFVRITEPLTLGCHIVVPPWPRSVVWYNKEGKVEPGDRYHVLEDGAGGYLLEIPSAEWPDEGEWKCVACSSGGRVGISTCYVSMDVPKNYRKPRFMENLQAVLTEEGLVSFECKVVGFPTPVLSWFKDGQELKPGDVYQLTGTNSLGSYCCIARNCMGQASSSAELTVEDIQNQLNEEEKHQLFQAKNQAPKFIQGLKSVEAKIDEPFRFTVKIAIPPEPSVLWYRDDQPVDESSRCHHGKEDRGVSYLDIQTLEFLDQAEWKCVAMNDFGHSVTSCFLKLIIPRHYKKPRFLENLQAILSDEGAVNLECKVIGVPQPVLKWYKDGEELKPGDIHRIISGQDGTCCLGTYTCEAQNCMGIAASSASLLGFDDSMKAKKKKAEEQALQRNLSLSTIHEERTSQMYDTPVGDITLNDDKGEISFSFDGKEVSVSLYETPDLTEEEALQIVEMYADQLSENITEHNVVELPPLRFVKETSTSGNLLMEAVIIDVSPDYFQSPDEDLRTEADVEDISIADENAASLLSLEQDDIGGEDYLEKTMALLSEEKSDIPRKLSRKKSDSQRSADDFFSLSRDQSLSEDKRDDDTQPISESDMPSFASAHSSGKPKSKSSKPSGEDGQESSEPTKTILFKDEAKKHSLEVEQTPAVKPKRERRSSRGSRRSSSGSEKSVSKSREEALRKIESIEMEAPKKPKISEDEFKQKMASISISLTKVINDVQIIERDIILKSELMSSAATASRSLEIISSLITPLSEIHSIADAAKEAISESKEVSSTLFNNLPQPLKSLQQSLTIIEKCIDMESDNKTLVKKTCVAFIKTCGTEMQQLISVINDVTSKDYLTTEDRVLTEIEALNKEMITVIKFSADTIKARNLISEAIDIKIEEPSQEVKHLKDTQKAVFELKSPLSSLLNIAESAVSGNIVDLGKATNSEVILNDMSGSIQDLQMALEQIESLSVKETTSSLNKYNTEIIETVMESVMKLRTSFEQLSTETRNEDKALLKQAVTSLKENLNKISTQIDAIESNVGIFDVLASENKLDVLQKMAQILINLENNLPRLESISEVKNNMIAFHKDLTKVLENVIESNESKKYFALMEICDGVNRINASIKNLDVEQIISLASMNNTLRIIQDQFVKNVFDSEINCSVLTNISETLVGLQEAINNAEEISIHVDSEHIQDITPKAFDVTNANVIVEHIEHTIAAIEHVKTIESTQQLQLNITPTLQNICPVLEELKRSVAAIKASGIDEEHLSEISDASSAAKTLATPICELNNNIMVLNQQIVENIGSMKENSEILATVAEPLHELYTTLEILQQDVISQYGEDITPYNVNINIADAVQTLQNCIVMIQEQTGIEGADEMSTLEDISGIKTTAETIPSDRLVLPTAEETAVEQALSSFGQEPLTTTTAQALQSLNEHIVVLQSPEIIDALDTLSEVSDYSSLKSFVVGLGELYTGLEEIFHPILMEGSNDIANLINPTKLMAIAEPMQDLQQSLSVLDTSNIPVYEHILEMSTEKVHSVIQSVTEFKEHLDKCMLTVFPAMQTADNTVEIANKVGALREVCEHLKDIIKTTKTEESIPMPEQVKALEITVDNLLDATDVSKGIKIEQVKTITEELYQRVSNVQEEIIQFVPHTTEKLAQEAKLIQTIDEVQSNIAVLQQYDFVDLSRASDMTCTSPQIAFELESDSLQQIGDIVDNAVNVVQDSAQETPIADLMIVEDFFKTCKNEFTILRCLMPKATSHKKIIRLLQEFSSLQSTVNDFKMKRHELNLSDDVNGSLATFLIHAEDCLQNVQSSLVKIVQSQASILCDVPLAKFEDSAIILKEVTALKQDMDVNQAVKTFTEILKTAKVSFKNVQTDILAELKRASYSKEDTKLLEKIEEFATFVELTKTKSVDSETKELFEKVSSCFEKHQDYRDASGTGKSLILIKCLSECADILQENLLEVKVPKQKVEIGALKEVLTEMLEPLQALHSQLINVQEQVLRGVDDDSISMDINTTESLVQTMAEKHKEIIERIESEASVANDEISLILEVDKEIHLIQDSLKSIENAPVALAVKEIAKPVQEIEKSLHLILSSEKVIEDKLPTEKTKQIIEHIDQYIELIEIIEEISAIIRIEDVKETMDIAKELRDTIAASDMIVEEDANQEKAHALRKEQARLAQRLQTALSALQVQVIESTHELAPELSTEVLQRIARVTAQLQADLVAVTGVRVALQAPTEHIVQAEPIEEGPKKQVASAVTPEPTAVVIGTEPIVLEQEDIIAPLESGEFISTTEKLEKMIAISKEVVTSEDTVLSVKETVKDSTEGLSEVTALNSSEINTSEQITDVQVEATRREEAEISVIEEIDTIVMQPMLVAEDIVMEDKVLEDISISEIAAGVELDRAMVVLQEAPKAIIDKFVQHIDQYISEEVTEIINELCKAVNVEELKQSVNIAKELRESIAVSEVQLKAETSDDLKDVVNSQQAQLAQQLHTALTAIENIPFETLQEVSHINKDVLQKVFNITEKLQADLATVSVTAKVIEQIEDTESDKVILTSAESKTTELKTSEATVIGEQLDTAVESVSTDVKESVTKEIQTSFESIEIPETKDDTPIASNQEEASSSTVEINIVQTTETPKIDETQTDSKGLESDEIVSNTDMTSVIVIEKSEDLVSAAAIETLLQNINEYLSDNSLQTIEHISATLKVDELYQSVAAAQELLDSFNTSEVISDQIDDTVSGKGALILKLQHALSVVRVIVADNIQKLSSVIDQAAFQNINGTVITLCAELDVVVSQVVTQKILEDQHPVTDNLCLEKLSDEHKVLKIEDEVNFKTASAEQLPLIVDSLPVEEILEPEINKFIVKTEEITEKDQTVALISAKRELSPKLESDVIVNEDIIQNISENTVEQSLTNVGELTITDKIDEMKSLTTEPETVINTEVMVLERQSTVDDSLAPLIEKLEDVIDNVSERIEIPVQDLQETSVVLELLATPTDGKKAIPAKKLLFDDTIVSVTDEMDDDIIFEIKRLAEEIVNDTIQLAEDTTESLILMAGKIEPEQIVDISEKTLDSMDTDDNFVEAEDMLDYIQVYKEKIPSATLEEIKPIDEKTSNVMADVNIVETSTVIQTEEITSLDDLIVESSIPIDSINVQELEENLLRIAQQDKSSQENIETSTVTLLEDAQLLELDSLGNDFAVAADVTEDSQLLKETQLNINDVLEEPIATEEVVTAFDEVIEQNQLVVGMSPKTDVQENELNVIESQSVVKLNDSQLLEQKQTQPFTENIKNIPTTFTEDNNTEVTLIIADEKIKNEQAVLETTHENKFSKSENAIIETEKVMAVEQQQVISKIDSQQSNLCLNETVTNEFSEVAELLSDTVVALQQQDEISNLQESSELRVKVIEQAVIENLEQFETEKLEITEPKGVMPIEMDIKHSQTNITDSNKLDQSEQNIVLEETAQTSHEIVGNKENIDCKEAILPEQIIEALEKTDPFDKLTAKNDNKEVADSKESISLEQNIEVSEKVTQPTKDIVVSDNTNNKEVIETIPSEQNIESLEKDDQINKQIVENTVITNVKGTALSKHEIQVLEETTQTSKEIVQKEHIEMVESKTPFSREQELEANVMALKDQREVLQLFEHKELEQNKQDIKLSEDVIHENKTLGEITVPGIAKNTTPFEAELKLCDTLLAPIVKETALEEPSEAVKPSKSVIEHGGLVEHIDEFLSNQITGLVEEISVLTHSEELKETVELAKALKESMEITAVEETKVLEVAKEEQVQLVQKLNDALSALHNKALENADEVVVSMKPGDLQRVSEIIINLQEDLETATVMGLPQILKSAEIVELLETEENSMKQLKVLLQEVTDKINVSTVRDADDTESLKDALDEVQTVIIKLKRDYDGAVNDTLNETLEDLECSVRSVQLQINEDSPPELLKEACATLQLLVNNMSETEAVAATKIEAVEVNNDTILEKCSSETDETITLLEVASKIKVKDGDLSSIINGLTVLKDTIKSLKSSFTGNAEVLIEKGVDITQSLDLLEEKVFGLEKELSDASINVDTKDSILTAVHSVYGSISNMRGTISSIQKRYMFENYGKPSEALLRSIKNVLSISEKDEKEKPIWKNFSKSLRKVHNHFEDIKFYINLDKTARLPGDAAFTKIILEELKSNIGETLVPQASVLSSESIKKVNTLLECLKKNLLSIESNVTLEVKMKIPIFKELSSQLLSVIECIKTEKDKQTNKSKNKLEQKEEISVTLLEQANVENIMTEDQSITQEISSLSFEKPTAQEKVQEDTLNIALQDATASSQTIKYETEKVTVLELPSSSIIQEMLVSQAIKQDGSIEVIERIPKVVQETVNESQVEQIASDLVTEIASEAIAQIQTQEDITEVPRQVTPDSILVPTITKPVEEQTFQLVEEKLLQTSEQDQNKTTDSVDDVQEPSTSTKQIETDVVSEDVTAKKLDSQMQQLILPEIKESTSKEVLTSEISLQEANSKTTKKENLSDIERLLKKDENVPTDSVLQKEDEKLLDVPSVSDAQVIDLTKGKLINKSEIETSESKNVTEKEQENAKIKTYSDLKEFKKDLVETSKEKDETGAEIKINVSEEELKAKKESEIAETKSKQLKEVAEQGTDTLNTETEFDTKSEKAKLEIKSKIKTDESDVKAKKEKEKTSESDSESSKEEKVTEVRTEMGKAEFSADDDEAEIKTKLNDKGTETLAKKEEDAGTTLKISTEYVEVKPKKEKGVEDKTMSEKQETEDEVKSVSEKSEADVTKVEYEVEEKIIQEKEEAKALKKYEEADQKAKASNEQEEVEIEVEYKKKEAESKAKKEQDEAEAKVNKENEAMVEKEDSISSEAGNDETETEIKAKKEKEEAETKAKTEREESEKNIKEQKETGAKTKKVKEETKAKGRKDKEEAEKKAKNVKEEIEAKAKKEKEETDAEAKKKKQEVRDKKEKDETAAKDTKKKEETEVEPKKDKDETEAKATKEKEKNEDKARKDKKETEIKVNKENEEGKAKPKKEQEEAYAKMGKEEAETKTKEEKEQIEAKATKDTEEAEIKVKKEKEAAEIKAKKEKEELEAKARKDKGEAEIKAKKEKEAAEAEAKKVREEAEAKAEKEKEEIEAKARKEKEEAEIKAKKEKEEAEAKAQKEREEAETKAKKEKEEIEAKARKDKEEAKIKAKKEKEEAEAKVQKEREGAEMKAKKEKEEIEAKARKEKKEAEIKAKKEKEEAEAKAQKEREEAETKANKEKEEIEAKARKDNEEAEIKAKKEKEEAEAKVQKEREGAEMKAMKEKEEIEAKDKKEKEEAEVKAKKEKKQAEAKAKKEKEEIEAKARKDKEEAEIKAKKEKEAAEAKAKKEREEAEEKAKKEKEEIEAKAIKDKEEAEAKVQKEREEAEAKAKKEKEEIEAKARKDKEEAEIKAKKEKEAAEAKDKKEREEAEEKAKKEKEEAEAKASKEREEAEVKAKKKKEKIEAKARKDKEEAEIKAKKEKEDSEAKAKKEKEEADAKAQKEREESEAKAKKEKEEAEVKAKKEKEAAEAKDKKEREEAESKAKKEKEEIEAKARKDKEEAEIKAKKEKEAAEAKAKKEREEAEEKAKKEKEEAEAKASKERKEAEVKAKKKKEKIEAKARKDKEEAEIKAKKEKEDSEAKAKKEKEEADAKAQKEREESEAKAKKEKEEAEVKAKKEKEAAEAKDKKEREEAEAKAKKEKEEIEAKARKDKEEAEIKAKKEKEAAEAKAKKEREEAEEKAKKEKEEAEAKASKEREEAEVKAKKKKEKIEAKARKDKEEAEIKAKKEKEDSEARAKKEKEEAEVKAKLEREEAEKIVKKEKDEAEAKVLKEKEETEAKAAEEQKETEIKAKKDKKEAEAKARIEKEETNTQAKIESEQTEKEATKERKAAEVKAKKGKEESEAKAKKQIEETEVKAKKQKTDAEAKVKRDKEEGDAKPKKEKGEAEAKATKDWEEAEAKAEKEKEEAKAQAMKEKEESEAKSKKQKEANIKKEKEDVETKAKKQKKETEVKAKKAMEETEKEKEDADSKAKKEKEEIESKHKEKAEIKVETEKEKAGKANKAKKDADSKIKYENDEKIVELDEKKISEDSDKPKRLSKKKSKDEIDIVCETESKIYLSSPETDARIRKESEYQKDKYQGTNRDSFETKTIEEKRTESITEVESKHRKGENGDIGHRTEKDDHYITEYQYEPSRQKTEERTKFVDHNHKDYSMDFLRPSGYTERSFRSEKYSERESTSLGKNATIYKAQTIILDSQLRSSVPSTSASDRSERSESERKIDRHRSKALSEVRSLISEKRSGLSRDLKRKPVFSTYLTDRTAVEGSRVKLTCSVLSSTDPKITWYKNGIVLDDKLKYRTKFVDGLITLEVLNAVPTDSAEYSCTVENENGSVNTSANLKVYPSFEASPIPPTFTRSIRDTYHLAENELVLECRIRGQPLPTITWLKDDRPVPTNERYQAYYLADGVCRLAISCPTAEDSGKYTCKAENSVWSDQITHVVSFTGKESRLSPNITTIERSRFNRQTLESRRPHFTNVLSDYNVVKGGTIGLQVEIRGCPTRVEWLREGHSVTEHYRNARTFVEQGLYTLALSDVTEKESGMYTCRAWSTHGNVDMNAAITVVPPNDMEGKPAIIAGRPEKDILISVGEDVNISFRVQGEPKPKVVFMKGIRDITTSQRVCKMTSDDYVKFTLKRSVVSDAGTYCVLARNAYGCDRAFVTVVVRQRASSENLISDWTYPMDDSALSIAERRYKSVPDRIPGEPSVVDGGNNWVSLAWPKSDPRNTAPVLAFRIESWLLGKEGGARWTELGITPLNSFDAFNLKQGEEYHFRVTPRNRYGWGESVQTSSPIGIGLAGDRPEFLDILPGQLKVLAGETAHLTCSVKGKPWPEVVWMKNGHEIEEEKRVTTVVKGQSCSLTIKDINEEDEGRYSCEASNVHGRASTYARLAVVTDRQIWEADVKLKRERSQDAVGDYPPQFTMRLRDRRVQATYPVRLTCQVVGHPSPSLTWYKDGEDVVFDSRRCKYQDEHFHTLEIAPTTLEDGGVYEAMARNSSGAVSCRCSLVVDKGIRAYVAPEFCCGLEPLYRLTEGEELRISAVVEAYPSVGVTWYRDGVRLRPSRRAIMTLDRDGQIELALASVTGRDAGVYTCTASNEVGRASTSGKVEIIGGDGYHVMMRSPPVVINTPDLPYSKEPMFIRKPRSSEAREGDTVIIECEVIGDPKPDVYWLRDFLKPDYYRDASHFKRVGDGPEYRFEIPHAKLDYTGAYSVVARNVHGEAKAIISLQILAKDITSTDDTHNVRYGVVEVLPRFERELQDLLSYDGDAVEFECRVTGNPEPDIRWFHYNELIRDCPDFESSFDDGAARLKIKQVTAEDEGTYSCEASNSLGKATSKACLVVYPPGEPNTLSQRLRRPPALLSAASTPRSTPRSTPARSVSRTPGPDAPRLCSPARQMAPSFYTYPFNKVVEEGENVSFQCAVKGQPVPWTTWDKDGIITTPSSRITMREKDEILRILEIDQVSIEDVGIYRITVENEFGRAEATARLEVITQKGKFYGGVRAYSASPRKSHSFRRYPSTSRD